MAIDTPRGIGGRLRDARVARGLSVEEAAWRTRIRPEVLRALEREQYGAIAHGGFIRGHISSYARFLGLDASDLTREYARRFEGRESQVAHLRRRDRQARRPPRPKWLLASAASAVLIAGAGLVGIVGSEPAAPSPAGEAIAPRSAAPPVSRSAPVRVTLSVSAQAPVAVTVSVDSIEVFAGMLEAGEERTFVGRGAIDLTAADAGAVRLNLNGVDLGAPGRPGAAYEGRFGPSGPHVT